MTKKLLATFVFLLIIGCMEVRGQYDPSFTHYWMMEPEYNPASTGSTENMRILGAFNAQMSGYDDAPTTMYAGVDLPMFFIGPSHGMGVIFMNDKLGLFEHKRLTAQYSYHFNAFGGRLGIGVQGDFLSETFDGDRLDVEDSDDQALSQASVNGSKIDAGAGLYYTRKNFYAGISALHLTAPTVDLGETNEISIKRSYYLTSGYNIKLRNPFFTIHPSVMGMYDGVDWKAYVSGRVAYTNEDKMLFGGASYSPSNSVALFVGGKFHGVVLSYSYEAYTSGIGLEHGAHEIIMSYEMKLNLYKKGKNIHKSVRLL